jgi:hypothetical protein
MRTIEELKELSLEDLEKTSKEERVLMREYLNNKEKEAQLFQAQIIDEQIEYIKSILSKKDFKEYIKRQNEHIKREDKEYYDGPDKEWGDFCYLIAKKYNLGIEKLF